MTQQSGRQTSVRIEGVTPEEYSAYWGCDHNGDHHPNQLGDGAFFYNFGSEIQERTPEWLDEFIAAIERTILKVKQTPQRFKPVDLEGLEALKGYVQGLRSIDPFVNDYLVAALWSEIQDNGDPFDKDFGVDAFAPEAIAKATEVCNQFKAQNAVDLAAALEQQGYDATSVAHDIWLTQNHHGVGFWDRKLGNIGERLTEAAHKLGELHVVVGEDGKLYLE